jgi:hypothetical protein
MTVTNINPSITSIQAPDALRELPGWLMWRYEHTDGEPKPRKVPYYANGRKRHGVQGRAEDRHALTSFEAARTAAARRGFDGIGFAPMPEWGVVALDFDNCVKAGAIHPDVETVIASTYAEFSPGGNGIRAFMRGHLGNLKAHGEPYGFETFSSKGFVTFTGNRLDLCDVLGTANMIADVNDETLDAIRRRFKREERSAASHTEEVANISKEQVAAILDALDPDMGHQPWLTVGMALHHQYRGSDEGFALWSEWSAASGKYPGDEAIRTRWNSFGRNPDKSITGRSLIKMGKEAGVYVSASAPATADEFEAVLAEVEIKTLVGKKTPRFYFEPVHQFSDARALPWVIKGVLPQAGLAVMYGASGSGKSFAALDMGMAIARGVEWRGRRVKQGRVAYIAAEGADGFRKRVAAYAVHNKVDLASVPMTVLNASPNLMEKTVAVDVVVGINTSGGADVVVVDTFAQTTPGANENAGEDVGKALSHCKRIHEATGALVLLIHHSGKDASKGARGWSGLRAAADAEIEVVREGNQRALQLTKNKDGEDGVQWGFALEVVELGTDEDVDPITSCVVVEAEAPISKTEGGKPMGKNEAVVFDVLREFSAVQTSGIEVAAVIVEAARRMPEPENGKRDTRKQLAKRALLKLCDNDALPFFLEGQEISVC